MHHFFCYSVVRGHEDDVIVYYVRNYRLEAVVRGHADDVRARTQSILAYQLVLHHAVTLGGKCEALRTKY